MSKVKECEACGQGLTEDNEPVGRAANTNCGDEHKGPIKRLIKSSDESLLTLFRGRLTPGDMKVDDYCLLRFLRARKLDVDKAHSHFLDWQEFYRANDLDHILARVPPKLAQFAMVLPRLDRGFSKNGCPVVYSRVGELNAQALMALVNSAELAALHCYHRKRLEGVMQEQSAQLGKNIDRMVAVLDLAGLNIQQLAAKDLVQVMFRLDERYYPESVDRILVVNAPWVFPKMFKAVAWMLDPHTRAKMIVCDANQQRETLLKYIEADQLLEEYGGSNKAPFPHADPARVLKELKEAEDTKLSQLRLTTAVVKPGATLKVPLVVSLGSEVSWYVKVQEKDVLFFVEFITDNEPVAYKVHPLRCHVHSGTYKVVQSGTLLFNFNNEYSLFASKTIRHSLEVIRPEVAPAESAETE